MVKHHRHPSAGDLKSKNSFFDSTRSRGRPSGTVVPPPRGISLRVDRITVMLARRSVAAVRYSREPDCSACATLLQISHTEIEQRVLVSLLSAADPRQCQLQRSSPTGGATDSVSITPVQHSDGEPAVSRVAADDLEANASWRSPLYSNSDRGSKEEEKKFSAAAVRGPSNSMRSDGSMRRPRTLRDLR